MADNGVVLPVTQRWMQTTVHNVFVEFPFTGTKWTKFVLTMTCAQSSSVKTGLEKFFNRSLTTTPLITLGMKQNADASRHTQIFHGHTQNLVEAYSNSTRVTNPMLISMLMERACMGAVVRCTYIVYLD